MSLMAMLSKQYCLRYPDGETVVWKASELAEAAGLGARLSNKNFLVLQPDI